MACFIGKYNVNNRHESGIIENTELIRKYFIDVWKPQDDTKAKTIETMQKNINKLTDNAKSSICNETGSEKCWHKSVAEDLIEKQLINLTDTNGITLIHVASAINCTKLITFLLLEKEANVNATTTTTKHTPLHVAGMHGACDAITVLKDSGAKMNEKDEQKQNTVDVSSAWW
ncbi:uncharacterized protein LOC144364008 [Saccoglossus kowalevskii]